MSRGLFRSIRSCPSTASESVRVAVGQNCLFSVPGEKKYDLLGDLLVNSLSGFRRAVADRRIAVFVGKNSWSGIRAGRECVENESIGDDGRWNGLSAPRGAVPASERHQKHLHLFRESPESGQVFRAYRHRRGDAGGARRARPASFVCVSETPRAAYHPQSGPFASSLAAQDCMYRSGSIPPRRRKGPPSHQLRSAQRKSDPDQSGRPIHSLSTSDQ